MDIPNPAAVDNPHREALAHQDAPAIELLSSERAAVEELSISLMPPST